MFLSSCGRLMKNGGPELLLLPLQWGPVPAHWGSRDSGPFAFRDDRQGASANGAEISRTQERPIRQLGRRMRSWCNSNGCAGWFYSGSPGSVNSRKSRHCDSGAFHLIPVGVGGGFAWSLGT